MGVDEVEISYWGEGFSLDLGWSFVIVVFRFYL